MVVPDLMELNKNSPNGRQDSPTVEQIVRAALYKKDLGSGLGYCDLGLSIKKLPPAFCKSNLRYEGLKKSQTNKKE